jgi:hypothetical protein
MNRSAGYRVLLASVLLLGAVGCKEAPKPFVLNNRIAEDNKKISKAADELHKKLAPLAANQNVNPGSVRVAIETVKGEIATARADVNTVSPGYLKEAQDFYNAYLKFLDAAESTLQQEGPKIQQIVEGNRSPGEKWAALQPIFVRMDKVERDELSRLVEAQKSFATAGHFKLPQGNAMGGPMPGGPR